jgi:hypothetical protein
MSRAPVGRASCLGGHQRVVTVSLDGELTSCAESRSIACTRLVGVGSDVVVRVGLLALLTTFVVSAATIAAFAGVCPMLLLLLLLTLTREIPRGSALLLRSSMLEDIFGALVRSHFKSAGLLLVLQLVVQRL